MSQNNNKLFDASMKSGIYLITCIPLNKHYVGISNNVVRRLNAHKSLLKRVCHDNKTLQEDYNKYGLTRFIFQKLQLGAGLNKKALENLETTILLTLLPKQRYNVYTNWRKRGSEINAFYNHVHTIQARQMQSLANKGKKSPFAGLTHTNDLKKLISQHNSGMTNEEKKKPLYIDGIYYESVSEASEKTGIQRRFIRKKCHSTEERFQNYQWAPKAIFF
jgi:group I intron endonuclease